jgi:PAS domain S-box-containing protein
MNELERKVEERTAHLNRRIEQLEREIAEYRQAETERREPQPTETSPQPQEFRALVESSPDIIARFDRNLRHLYVNPAIEAETGIPLKEFIGKTNRELGMPEDVVSFWEESLRRVFQTGRGDEIEYSFPSPQGTKYYQSCIIPEFEADGSVKSLLGTTRDITQLKQAEFERQQAYEQLERRVAERTAELERANERLQQEIAERQQIEDALKHQQAFLQTVIDTNPNLIFVKDREGKYLLANQAFLDRYGLTAEEVLGKTVEQINSNPTDVELFTAQDRDVFATQQPQFNPEYACHLPTGEVRWYQSIKKPFASEEGQNTRLLCVCVDITRRKRMEEALRESEARYRLLLERMNEGLVINDRNDEIAYVNPKLGEILGYSPAELVGHHWSEFLDESNWRIVSEQMAKDRRGESSTYTLEPRRKDGRALSVIVSATPILGSDGSYEGSFGVVTDVTALKTVEWELQQAKAQLQAVLDAIPGSVSWMDARGRYIGVNQHLAATLDVSPDTFVGKELGFQRNSSEFVEFMRQFLASPTQTDRKIVEVGVGETKRNYLIAAQKYVQGEMAVSVGIDVTEGKRAQEALRAQTEFLQTVLDTNPNLIWVKHADGRVMLTNQACAEFFGVSVDSILDKTLTQLNPSEAEVEHCTTQDEEVLSTLQEKFIPEEVFVSATGERRWFQTIKKPLFGRNGEADRIFGVATDITARKQAEEKLRQREEQLNLALDAARMGYWDWNLETGEVTWSYHLERIFGLAPNTFDGNYETFYNYLYPDDRDRVQQAVQDYLASGEDLQLEFRIVLPDGRVRWLEGKGRLYYNETGTPVRMTGINLDITDRKQAQEALQAQTEFLRTVLDTNPSLIYVKDREGRFVLINQGFADFYGLPAEEIIGKTDPQLHPYLVEVERFLAQEEEIFTIGQPKFVREEVIHTPTGVAHWFQTTKTPVFDGKGEIEQILGVSTDITERLQIEEQLRQSEEQLRLALDAARMGFWNCNLQTDEITWSENLEQLYGFAPNTFDGTYEMFRACLHPEDRERFEQASDRAVETGEMCNIEFRILWPDGSLHWIQSQGQAYYDEAGTPVRMTGINLDITARKQAEEQFRQSEERLHLALDAARMGFWDRNLQTWQGVWSNNLERLYGFAPRTYDGTYETFLARIHPDDRDRVFATNQRSLQSGGHCDLEFRVVLPDGSIHWIQSQSQVYYDETNQPVRMSGIDVDISDRKRAQLRIQESLQEKEVLLQEIHHRVKNNLQIICSLLDLQAQHIEEAALLEMFRESQHRVRSMALVHEKLYQSQDCAKINFAEYIESLTSYLFQAYAVDAANVALMLDIDKVILDIDTAIPCGLIINELVSNALKHAFYSHAEGEINVALKAISEQDFLLRVRDNGRGLPANFDLNKVKSLGLQLVKVLTKQLEGTLEINGENGTEFCIRFSKF